MCTCWDFSYSGIWNDYWKRNVGDVGEEKANMWSHAYNDDGWTEMNFSSQWSLWHKT